MKGVTLEVDNEGVIHLLAGIADRAEDLTPVAKAWEMIMLRSAQKTFLAQGRPEAWPGLAPVTIARRKKEGRGAQILRDTGYLMQSLTPESLNEYSYRNVGDDFAEIGTTRPGAENHQMGVTLPKREFLKHQPEDIADYKLTLSDFILLNKLEHAETV